MQKILSEKNDIYTSTYKGWYCVSDETFLQESQLKECETTDGKKILVSAESGHPVEWTEEQNYMFKLSSYKDELLKWIVKNGKKIIDIGHFLLIQYCRLRYSSSKIPKDSS